jgi:hypothetical protein
LITYNLLLHSLKYFYTINKKGLLYKALSASRGNK